MTGKRRIRCPACNSYAPAVWENNQIVGYKCEECGCYQSGEMTKEDEMEQKKYRVRNLRDNQISQDATRNS